MKYPPKQTGYFDVFCTGSIHFVGHKKSWWMGDQKCTSNERFDKRCRCSEVSAQWAGKISQASVAMSCLTATKKNGIQPIASTEESNRVGAYQWISVADIRISDIRTWNTMEHKSKVWPLNNKQCALERFRCHFNWLISILHVNIFCY